jgi:hypothetical protein
LKSIFKKNDINRIWDDGELLLFNPKAGWLALYKTTYGNRANPRFARTFFII